MGFVNDGEVETSQLAEMLAGIGNGGTRGYRRNRASVRLPCLADPGGSPEPPDQKRRIAPEYGVEHMGFVDN